MLRTAILVLANDIIAQSEVVTPREWSDRLERRIEAIQLGG